MWTERQERHKESLFRSFAKLCALCVRAVFGPGRRTGSVILRVSVPSTLRSRLSSLRSQGCYGGVACGGRAVRAIPFFDILQYSRFCVYLMVRPKRAARIQTGKRG